MTPERWRQIDELLQSALELMPEQRAAFLDVACAGDRELRREVESLLASDEQGLSIIDAPALEAAAGLLVGNGPELTAGESIGPYKIIALLGTGGMGEVYLARDTKLGRKIALKLLPGYFSKVDDRLRRFRQEARAVSALNHPNILTIHEIGQVGGRHFIATEFVDGQTLRQRLGSSNLSLREAVDIASQVAGALAAAHEAGIVHRDIKPENIMLRRDGYVKVLDFGLAKLTEHYSSSVDTRAPTTRKVDTVPGLVMGTVRYMSPEQARGQVVDARSDIFSFGVVLYEMLTGHVPFEGETASDLIATILKDEPAPLRQHLTDIPDELQQILDKALRKNRAERYPTAQELLTDLKGLRVQLESEVKPSAPVQAEAALESSWAGTPEGARTAAEVATATAERRAFPALLRSEYIISEIKQHKTGAGLALAAIFTLTAAVGFVGYKLIDQPGPSASVINAELTRLTTSGLASNAAISPDGRYVAYVVSDGGQNSVWLRQAATNGNVQIVPSSEAYCWGLVFSRDGNYLYYYMQGKGDPAPSLYRMPALGGPTQRLITGVEGGTISFSPDGGRLAFVGNYHSGETAVVVANADGRGERKIAARTDPAFFSSASWSSDGKRIACAGRRQDGQRFLVDLVEVQVDSGATSHITDQEWRLISDVAWLPDGGWLVLAKDREDSSAQIWQISSSKGPARRVTTDLNGYSGLSLTADGTAVVTTRTSTVSNIWTQPAGNPGQAKQITSGAATKDGWSGIAWTPDGRIVYSSQASGRPEVWIMNPDGSDKQQLTVDLGSNFYGLSVSPDGRYIVFVSTKGGGQHIWRIDADGGEAKQLTAGSGEINPSFWPDGRWVTYRTVDDGKLTQWRVPIGGGPSTQMRGPSPRTLGATPDGKLVAYIPPGPQGERQRIAVAPAEGGEPIRIFELPPGGQPPRARWTPDGRALTYIVHRGSASNIWKQPLDGGPPEQLTDFKDSTITAFAWSPDGRLLAVARGGETSDVVLLKDFR